MIIKKIWSFLTIGIFAFSCISSLHSKEVKNVYADESLEAPVLYNTVEHDVYNTGSVGAVTNNVDAIRFLMTEKVGVKENHLDLYFGLKETLDLSISNSTLDV